MPDVTLPYDLTDGTTADADQVMANFAALRAAVNALDGENLSTALAQVLGVNQAGSTRRAGVDAAGTVAIPSTSLVTVAAAPAIEVPDAGLVYVTYQAEMRVVSASGATAGATQGKASVVLNGVALSEASLLTVTASGTGQTTATGPTGWGAVRLGSNAAITGFSRLDLVDVPVQAVQVALPCVLAGSGVSPSATVEVKMRRSDSGVALEVRNQKLKVWAVGAVA